MLIDLRTTYVLYRMLREKVDIWSGIRKYKLERGVQKFRAFAGSKYLTGTSLYVAFSCSLTKSILYEFFQLLKLKREVEEDTMPRGLPVSSLKSSGKIGDFLARVECKRRTHTQWKPWSIHVVAHHFHHVGLQTKRKDENELSMAFNWNSRLHLSGLMLHKTLFRRTNVYFLYWE